MMKTRLKMQLSVPVLVMLSLASPAIPFAQTEASGQPEAGRAAQAITLDQLEQMALEHNPTLSQAQADVAASKGREIQAGLYPNPVVGYEGREISSGPIVRGGEHGFFVQQTIVTFGKLGLSRKVFGEEEAQAETVAAAQRLRVINGVRVAYYDALGAQELVQVRNELAGIAERAVQTSKQLFNVGQANQPDVLEARVEAERADLELVAARNDQLRIWQQLAATVGNPSLPLSPLAGKLDDTLAKINGQEALARVLRGSPEVKLAEQGITRAEMALKRARIESRPNLLVGGGLDYNRELLGGVGTQPVGWEGSVQVGVEVPIFNRNQGNIKAAAAELAHARSELDRVRMSLRSSFAEIYRNYANSLEDAQRYQNDILPQAQQAYDLYLKDYRQMAAAYPQVLIAQRTLFQLRENYVKSLINFQEARAEIEGFLLTNGLAAPIAPGEPATVSPGIEVRPAGAP